MFLSSYINIAFQSRSVHFSPVWSISLYLVCVFFLILVYWLKHIFRSITSKSSIKSIIAPFFSLQIIFEKILMDLLVLPLGIIMLLFFIYGLFFSDKHNIEYENEKSILILVSNASLLHCEVT